MACDQDQYMTAADEIARTPFTVIGEQHSWTGSAHALASRPIQRVGLGPRATGRRERLDGRQGAGAVAVTAHGEERLAEHREAEAAAQMPRGVGFWARACATQAAALAAGFSSACVVFVTHRRPMTAMAKGAHMSSE